MTQCVKALAAKPDDLSLILRIHTAERDPTTANCLLSSPHALWHTSSHNTNILTSHLNEYINVF